MELTMEEHFGFLIGAVVFTLLVYLYYTCNFFRITEREFDIYLDRHIHGPLRRFFREWMTEEIRFSTARFLAIVSAAFFCAAFTQLGDVFVMRPWVMVPLFAITILSALLTYDPRIPASRRLGRCMLVCGILLMGLGTASLHLRNYHKGVVVASIGTAVVLLALILHLIALVHNHVMLFIARRGVDAMS